MENLHNNQGGGENIENTSPEINWNDMASELETWPERMELEPQEVDEAAEAAIFEHENLELGEDQPELEVNAEDVGQEAGEVEKAETEELELEEPQKDEVFAEMLTEMTDDTRRLEETREELQDAKQGIEEVEALREELGVTTNDPKEEIRLQELEEREAVLVERLVRIENKLLGVEDETKFLEIREEIIERYPREYNAEFDEIMEAKSREIRKKFVETYLKNELELIEEGALEFSGLNYVDNEEEAKKVIAAKVAANIIEYSKRFIRDGGWPDFGYHLHIHYGTFENKDGAWKTYVSNVEVAGGIAWIPVAVS